MDFIGADNKLYGTRDGVTVRLCIAVILGATDAFNPAAHPPCQAPTKRKGKKGRGRR